MTERRDPGWLRRYWLAFTLGILAVFVVCFGAPETVGVVSPGVGGTYTEWLQDTLGITEGGVTAGWTVVSAFLLGGAVWLVVHLQGWWPWEKDPGGEGDETR